VKISVLKDAHHIIAQKTISTQYTPPAVHLDVSGVVTTPTAWSVPTADASNAPEDTI